MGRNLSWFVFASILSLSSLVAALPAPQPSESTTATATTAAPSTTVQTSTSATPLETIPPSASESTSSPVKTIIIVIIFVVLPIIALWFCCLKRQLSMLSCLLGRSKDKKRQFYNSAHPNQIPGGVYLVPVQHFTPPEPRTGYTVRVDNPANVVESGVGPVGPAPMYEVAAPMRAASPAGRDDGRNGGWKGLFKG